MHPLLSDFGLLLVSSLWATGLYLVWHNLLFLLSMMEIKIFILKYHIMFWEYPNVNIKEMQVVYTAQKIFFMLYSQELHCYSVTIDSVAENSDLRFIQVAIQVPLQPSRTTSGILVVCVFTNTMVFAARGVNLRNTICVSDGRTSQCHVLFFSIFPH